jgi:epoxyqueuosine reductase
VSILKSAIRFSGAVSKGEVLENYGNFEASIGLICVSPVIQLKINRLFTRLASCADVETTIARFADDAASAGGMILFALRWSGVMNDSYEMVRMDLLCDHVSQIIKGTVYRVEPIRPLTTTLNLPEVSAAAGLGNLNPYGLLVHKVFGPRIVLGGLRTDYPFGMRPRWEGGGCDDCGECLQACPQRPRVSGEINLRQCARCAKCVTVCPVGKGQAERKIVEGLEQY